MLCEHLKQLEDAILKHGARETFRGKPWSQNCREWVYFDCYIDTDAVSKAFPLPTCVKIHAHRGTHDGEERGFVCHECWDAVIGSYEPKPGMLIFNG